MHGVQWSCCVNGEFAVVSCCFLPVAHSIIVMIFPSHFCNINLPRTCRMNFISHHMCSLPFTTQYSCYIAISTISRLDLSWSSTIKLYTPVMRHGCRIRTILKYFCNKKKQQAGGVAFANSDWCRSCIEQLESLRERPCQPELFCLSYGWKIIYPASFQARRFAVSLF